MSASYSLKLEESPLLPEILFAVASSREKKIESMSRSASQMASHRSHVMPSHGGSIPEPGSDNQPNANQEGSLKMDGDTSCKSNGSALEYSQIS